MSKRMGGSRFAKLTSTHPGPWTVEESKELAAEATRARASELEWKRLAAQNFQVIVASVKERDEWKAKAGEMAADADKLALVCVAFSADAADEIERADAAEARAEELREQLIHVLSHADVECYQCAEAEAVLAAPPRETAK